MRSCGLLLLISAAGVAAAAAQPNSPGARAAGERPPGFVREAALHPPTPAVAAPPPSLAARWAMRPTLVVKVDVGEQTMRVMVDGDLRHTFKVSTAGPGYVTPRGVFTPYRMHTMWRSRKYDNAPMPHAIFYDGGYAIHATPHVRRLGSPASHGCVRLHPDDARMLFDLVLLHKRARMRVVIED